MSQFQRVTYQGQTKNKPVYACRSCTDMIVWWYNKKEKEEQKIEKNVPLNLDGTVHRCEGLPKAQQPLEEIVNPLDCLPTTSDADLRKQLNILAQDIYNFQDAVIKRLEELAKSHIEIHEKLKK